MKLVSVIIVCMGRPISFPQVLSRWKAYTTKQCTLSALLWTKPCKKKNPAEPCSLSSFKLFIQTQVKEYERKRSKLVPCFPMQVWASYSKHRCLRIGKQSLLFEDALWKYKLTRSDIILPESCNELWEQIRMTICDRLLRVSVVFVFKSPMSSNLLQSSWTETVGQPKIKTKMNSIFSGFYDLWVLWDNLWSAGIMGDAVICSSFGS